MAQAAEEKRTRHRSPAYPTVGLREAVERADKFYKTDHKAGAPPEIAVKHMGFTTAHGQAMSVLAALKKFGLVAEANGRIVPTQRAIEIIELPANDQRRVKALKDAALSPAIYHELIEQHRETGWPADDVLQAELKTYRNFNPNSVEGFVKDLKDTIEYAGLSDLSVLESGSHEGENGHDEPLKVGDYAQWESNGILQFSEARRIREFSKDGQFAFVEGSTTGLPVKELSVVDTPREEQYFAEIPIGAKGKVQPNLGRTPVGNDIPVSSDCIMGVNAIGHVTQGGIDKLIAYLQLIKGSFPANGN